MFRYRGAWTVIVELLTIAEAVLLPDRLCKFLSVDADQRSDGGTVDHRQQRRWLACEFQSLFDMRCITPIRRLELLERCNLNVEDLCDVNRTEFRTIVTTFTRAIRPVR